MNITEVKVHPVEQEKLKAYVSIVLDDCFLVSDIKIISGPTGLFVSMPSKRKKTGEFKDVAHPLNRETRHWMEQRILGEYDRSIHVQPEAVEPKAAEQTSATTIERIGGPDGRHENPGAQERTPADRGN